MTIWFTCPCEAGEHEVECEDSQLILRDGPNSETVDLGVTLPCGHVVTDADVRQLMDKRQDAENDWDEE